MSAAAQGPASGHRKRLRDRFHRGSLDGFHDYEVVELLLTYAIPRRDVKPLAKRLISEFGGLKGLLEAPAERLVALSGLGQRSVVLLAMIRQAAMAYLSESSDGRRAVCSPADAVRCVAEIGGAGQGFFAIYLNSKNEVLGVEAMQEGQVDRSGVSARTVIQKAFSHNARSVVLVHCKAGKAAPAKADRALAAELDAAASSIDILIHDYIVAGAGSHVSAREMGWLSRPAYS